MTDPCVTILVVDDDARLLRSYRLLLSRSFRVHTASTAAEARAVAARERPQLAIVDVCLGDDSGIAVLQDLKAEQPELRVAIVSANVTIDLTVIAVRAGADAVVAKPATVAEILRRLDNGPPPTLDRLPPATLARVEYEHIARVVADSGGNVTRAARKLGIYRSTLQRKLRKSPPR